MRQMTNYAPFLDKLSRLGVFHKFATIQKQVLGLQDELTDDIVQELTSSIKLAEDIQQLLFDQRKLSDFTSSELASRLQNMAIFFCQHGMAAIATDFLSKAIDLYPDESSFYAILAKTLLSQNQHDNATIALKEALRRNPKNPEIWRIAAQITCKLGEYKEAIKCIEHIFEADSLNRPGKRLLANVFVELNLYEQANHFLQDLIKSDPEDHDALYQRGLLKLRQGDLTGWKDYEHRFETKDIPSHHYPQLTQEKRWKGENLKGKKIFVVNDQDATYSLLFSSLIPGLIDEAVYCIIEGADDFATLFARAFPDTGFTISDQIEFNAKIYHFYEETNLQNYDYWIPLGSIPQYRLENYVSQSQQSILKPTEKRLAQWKDQFKNLNNQLTIGINTQLYDFLSPLWEEWRELFTLSHCTFFALNANLDPQLAEKYGIRPCPYALDDSLEAKAGFLDQLSFIVSPFSIESHLGALLGRPIIQLTQNNQWSLLGKKTNSFFPKMDILTYSLEESFDIQIAQLASKVKKVIQNGIKIGH
jgi:Tfp pilus assembly protein PilF